MDSWTISEVHIILRDSLFRVAAGMPFLAACKAPPPKCSPYLSLMPSFLRRTLKSSQILQTAAVRSCFLLIRLPFRVTCWHKESQISTTQEHKIVESKLYWAKWWFFTIGCNNYVPTLTVHVIFAMFKADRKVSGWYIQKMQVSTFQFGDVIPAAKSVILKHQSPDCSPEHEAGFGSIVNMSNLIQMIDHLFDDVRGQWW